MKNHYLAAILNSDKRVLDLVSGIDAEGTYEDAASKASITEGAADIIVIANNVDRYIAEAIELAVRNLLGEIQPLGVQKTQFQVKVIGKEKPAVEEAQVQEVPAASNITAKAIQLNLLKAIACMEFAKYSEHTPLAVYFSRYVEQYEVAYRLSGADKELPKLEGIQRDAFDKLMDRIDKQSELHEVYIDVPDYQVALEKIRDNEAKVEKEPVYTQVKPEPTEEEIDPVGLDLRAVQSLRGVGRPSAKFYDEWRKNWVSSLTEDDWAAREEEARKKLRYVSLLAKWKFWDRQEGFKEKGKGFLLKANKLRRELEVTGFTKPKALNRIREDVVTTTSEARLKRIVKEVASLLEKEKVYDPMTELTDARVEEMYLLSWIRDLEDRLMQFKVMYRAGYSKMPEYNRIVREITKKKMRLRNHLDRHPYLK